jgi:hypothetical protein
MVLLRRRWFWVSGLREREEIIEEIYMESGVGEVNVLVGCNGKVGS